ncbi:MAG: anti-sigma factor [Vulcanimicrobiaceae bacterium]
MQPNHDEILDLVAAYALGVVRPEEARIVSAHLAVCPECRREYNALRPAANAIGLAAEDTTIGAGLRDRMKQRIFQTIARQSSRPVSSRRPLVIAAALALAAAVALAIIDVDNAQRLNQARMQLEQDRRVVAVLGTAHAQSFVVPHGEILKADDRIYIVMRSIPPLTNGRVYQAWTLAPGAKKVSPSMTFVPNQQGFVVISLPESGTNVAAVAVSVEPRGGSRAPTTKPIFVRPLS